MLQDPEIHQTVQCSAKTNQPCQFTVTTLNFAILCVTSITSVTKNMIDIGADQTSRKHKPVCVLLVHKRLKQFLKTCVSH